jgi:hypothetical protein
MAGNKIPTPAELEVIRAEFESRYRAEGERLGPESPVMAARNAAAQAFWKKVDRLVDARTEKAPSALRAAIDTIDRMKRDGVPGRRIPSLEELLVGDELRTSRKQSAVGRKKRPKAQSPFTAFITQFLKRNPGADADEISALLDDARAGESGEFALSKDKLTILTTDGDSKRQLKVSGIAMAVTKARKRKPGK